MVVAVVEACGWATVTAIRCSAVVVDPASRMVCRALTVFRQVAVCFLEAICSSVQTCANCENVDECDDVMGLATDCGETDRCLDHTPAASDATAWSNLYVCESCKDSGAYGSSGLNYAERQGDTM